MAALPPFSVTVLRPRDLLSLEFRLEGFQYSSPAKPGSGKPRSLKPDGSGLTRITVTFPPQHILEEAFWEGGGRQTCDFRALVKKEAMLLEGLPAGGYSCNIEDFAREIAAQTGLFIPGPLTQVWVTKADEDTLYFLGFKLLRKPALDGLIPLVVYPPPGGGTPAAPVRARLSGPSTLVFDASSVGSFALTTEGLLEALRYCPLSLADTARFELGARPPAGQAPPIQMPAETQTRIEAPYRLLISPTELGRFDHAAGVLSSAHGRDELWHTRLGIVLPVSDRYPFRDDQAHIRAIWALDKVSAPLLPDCSADQVVAHDTDPFLDPPGRVSLDAADRYNLVHLTANYSLDEGEEQQMPVTAPVDARRLMLSSLGAWLDLQGNWPVTQLRNHGKALSVSEWRHRATLGRDHYVRVVYEGFLYPFGHRAALIKITERKLPLDQGDAQAAYLWQRMFIVVREPEKQYGEAGRDLFADPAYYSGTWPLERVLPFRSVRILTVTTPNLDIPSNHEALPDLGQSAFWPYVTTPLNVDPVPFQFQIRAVDQDGRSVEFGAPLAFLALDAYLVKQNLIDLNAKYNAPPDPVWEGYRTRPLSGQIVAYAPMQEGAGATAFPTHSIKLGAVLLDQADALLDRRELAFWPLLTSAQVAIPDLQHLAGVGSDVELSYPPIYLTSGFDGAANQRGDFADVAVDLDFSKQAERSGALLTPNLKVTALTRQYGPVGGTYSPTFEPQSYFSGALPKLLGQFDLAGLIGPGGDFPLLHRSGAATTYTLNWPNAPLQSVPGFQPRDGSSLSLSVTTDVPSGGGKPSVTVDATLTSFDLVFADAVCLKFVTLHFSSSTGRKPDVEAALLPFAPPQTPVEFRGQLGFISALANLIPSGGFSDPPSLEVTPDGLAASYSATFPTVAIGAFALQNLALGAALTLPFTEKPASVRFHFAERHAPCIVSVGPFAGGGFLALEMNTGGLQVLEMALEFGACLGVNLGVASGSVYVMGGIYFKYEGQALALTGYFRLGGEVDVLGLISASIEVYFGLSYDANTRKASGSASIEVEVEICFFSFSVSISCERHFAGSEGDPSFADVMGSYYVHAPTGQVLYCDPATQQVFYLDPWMQTQAWVYDPAQGYQPKPIGKLDPVPCRPGTGPAPDQAQPVNPWLAYCQAFVKA